MSQITQQEYNQEVMMTLLHVQAINQVIMGSLAKVLSQQNGTKSLDELDEMLKMVKDIQRINIDQKIEKYGE